jgi:hypothetical protein
MSGKTRATHREQEDEEKARKIKVLLCTMKLK